MSEPGFKDHFSAKAARYAEYRPRYPEALFDWLATLTAGHRLAWDAGTGNGQAALPLAERFELVLATDASAKQLAQATLHARIRYAVGRETASGLADASCDLVTAAQALHWFDIPGFFAEARRVLRPDGAVAVWGYAQPRLTVPGCDEVLQRYVQRMAPWWPPERAMVEDRYASIDLPIDEVHAPPFQLRMMVEREGLLGYLRTWSAYGRYTAARPDDPVADIAADLARTWPDGMMKTLEWPLFVRAGRLQ